MDSMKARWESKCGRCGLMIHVGDAVSTAYGNFWHVGCVLAYRSQRQGLAASGAK